MYRKIPEYTKSLVIKQWLEGIPRDMIAANSGLSAGAVTNIINEWRRGLGAGVIDDLRELGVTFRKVGITPSQCATGFRTSMLISKLGVREEQIDSFISDLVRSIDLGLSPENIAFYIKGLLEFSKTNSGNSNNSSNIIVPLGQISEFVQHKAEEKKKLEEEIQTLKNQIKILNEEKSNSEQRRNSALYQEHTTDAELKSFSELKQELGHYGLPLIYDIPKFAKAVRGLRQNGYDVPKIITEYSEYEDMKRDYYFYQARIPGLKMKCSQLEGWENCYTQRLSLIYNLQDMEFGFKELKSLSNTIVEISYANNVPREDAVKRFFKEIDEHYDDILGLQLRKQKLEAENRDLGQQNLELSANMSILTRFAGPFARLLFDFVVTNSPEEVILFIDKVHKVGGIKNAIEKLSDHPTLAADSKTAILSNNGNKNDISSQPEKYAKIKLARISMVYQPNISSIGETKNDLTTVLPVDDYTEDNGSSNNIGKERVKQEFGQENDPSFKSQINQVIYRRPYYHLKSDDDTRGNIKQQVDNNNFNNNAANNVEVAQTDNNMLIQKETLLPLPATQSNGPAKYFDFNSNLAFMSACCLLKLLLARRMSDRENIIQR